MIEFLVNIDQRLFLLINRGLANPFFDMLMPLMRSKYFWAPLYLFLIVFFIKNDGKKGLMIILFMLITFMLTDLTSAQLIKPWVQRLRPCNDPEILGYIRSIVGCGPGYSFVSSHAANHFGIASFLALIFSDKRWVGNSFKIWAVLICFAQVYVGVHYPLDVIIGGFLGVILGGFTYFVFSRTIRN